MVGEQIAQRMIEASQAHRDLGQAGAPIEASPGAGRATATPGSDVGRGSADGVTSPAFAPAAVAATAGLATRTEPAMEDSGVEMANRTGTPGAAARATDGARIDAALQPYQDEGVEIPDRVNVGNSAIVALRMYSTDSLEETYVTGVVEASHDVEKYARYLSGQEQLDDAESLLKLLVLALSNWLKAQENLHAYYEYNVRRIVRVDASRVGAGAKLSAARRGVPETPSEWREDDFDNVWEMLRELKKTLDRQARAAEISNDNPREMPVAKAPRAARRWRELALTIKDRITLLDKMYIKLARRNTQIIVTDDRGGNVH
jgi:hypothetical protein